MLRKAIIHNLLGKAQKDKLKVKYWDNTEETFGHDGRLVGTLTFHTSDVLGRMAKDHELGFAEGYMDGEIDFDGRLHDLILFASQNSLGSGSTSGRLLQKLARGFGRATSVHEQKADIHHHYDLGNQFFQLFLDATMTYSCAYFRTEKDSLKQAQEQKVAHILKKLNLKKDERLLDIGSGWGQLILTAAKKYGVKAHGITMSEEQLKKTRERIKEEKLEDLVTVELTDYRELAKTGVTYDKIASVGMFEHVGRPNLGLFMDAINTMLVPGGLMILHFITRPHETNVGVFTTKYIFPGGYLPSVRETVALMPERNFSLLDIENLRPHYALTLDKWSENFEKNLDKVREIFANRERLGERWGGLVEAEKFIRMWRIYLDGSAAGFRAGTIELHQFLFSKGLPYDYPLTREAWYN